MKRDKVKAIFNGNSLKLRNALIENDSIEFSVEFKEKDVQSFNERIIQKQGTKNPDEWAKRMIFRSIKWFNLGETKKEFDY